MLRFRSMTSLCVFLSLLTGMAASQQKAATDQKAGDTVGGVSPESAVPELTIEVVKRERIAGIPPAMPTLEPTFPLPDGGMLVRIVHLPTTQPDPVHLFKFDPEMYRIKSAQEINRFDDFYPGLSDVISDGKVAVSKNQVVLLVHAITNDEKRNAPDTPPHQFLVFYDFNGRQQKVAAVDVSPQVS